MLNDLNKFGKTKKILKLRRTRFSLLRMVGEGSPQNSPLAENLVIPSPGKIHLQ